MGEAQTCWLLTLWCRSPVVRARCPTSRCRSYAIASGGMFVEAEETHAGSGAARVVTPRAGPVVQACGPNAVVRAARRTSWLPEPTVQACVTPFVDFASSNKSPWPIRCPSVDFQKPPGCRRGHLCEGGSRRAEAVGVWPRLARLGGLPFRPFARARSAGVAATLCRGGAPPLGAERQAGSLRSLLLLPAQAGRESRRFPLAVLWACLPLSVLLAGAANRSGPVEEGPSCRLPRRQAGRSGSVGSDLVA